MHEAVPLEERTLPRVLYARAQRSPDGVFLSDERGGITASAMLDAAGAVRSGLEKLGVGRGDRVAIMLPSCREFVEAWFGVAFAGAIEVPISPYERGGRLEHVFRQSRPRVAIVDADVVDELDRAGDAASAVEHLVIVGAARDGRASLSFADLRSHGANTDPSTPRFSDPVAVMYTSGSTGAAKGAILSHAHHYTNGLQPTRLFAMLPQDTVLSCLPMHHNMAQGYAVWPALVSGARVHLAAFSSKRFWQEVRASGATIWPFIGAMLVLVIKDTSVGEGRGTTLRVGYGVPVPATVQAEFESRFGVELVEGYGSTEATIVTWNVGPHRAPGSAGAALAEYDVAIMDDVDRAVPTGVIGQICVRPRAPFAMFSGYYADPERTVAAWRNLWFHTGDRGRLDDRGRLWFVDRIGDSIRIKGENVSASEVESAVLAHPDVKLVAAFGVPSELTDEDLMITIVPKSGRRLSAAVLRAWCEAHVARVLIPRYIDIAEELPMTPTGKVLKNELRRRGVASGTYDHRAGQRL